MNSKIKREQWVLQITAISDAIRDRITGLAWVVEVEVQVTGEKEKGSVKYSEARGIYYSDKGLSEEDDIVLYFILLNLKDLVLKVNREFHEQEAVRKSLEETWEAMNQKSD